MTTSPYIHPVPVGATIPAGTKYAVVMDRISDFTQGGVSDDYPRFTADPIPAPRPAPPTEPGTVLLDVTMMDGRTLSHLFLADASRAAEYPWVGAVGYSYDWFATDDLVSWTVADVTPRTNPETIPEWERELLAKGAPDPLDENDHRPRVRNEQALTRRKCGRWHTSGAGDLCPLSEHSPDALETFTLASWNRRRPVRFADEVQS